MPAHRCEKNSGGDRDPWFGFAGHKGFAEVTIHAAIAAIQGNPLPESSIKIEAVTMENVAAYLQAEAASHSTPAS